MSGCLGRVRCIMRLSPNHCSFEGGREIERIHSAHEKEWRSGAGRGGGQRGGSGCGASLQFEYMRTRRRGWPAGDGRVEGGRDDQSAAPLRSAPSRSPTLADRKSPRRALLSTLPAPPRDLSAANEKNSRRGRAWRLLPIRARTAPHPPHPPFPFPTPRAALT